MRDRIIPIKATQLRQQWFKKLGNLQNVSVKNKEWMILLEEDTRNSLMIEGYFVTRAELKDAIENPKYNAIGYKILGYFDAAVASYELAFQQYQTNEFKLTKSIIRQIHSLMFRGDPNFSWTPGEWRKGGIEITGAKVQASSPFDIEKHVEQLIEIINSPTDNLSRKIAVSHDMFEQIHPFPDGNGRVGRILMNFILVAHGCPNIAIKGSSAEKRLYTDALEAADPIVAAILKSKDIRGAFNHPLPKMEDLISKSLAAAMDVIICTRFEEKEPLMPASAVAKAIGKDVDSFRVACSQKKFISMKVDRILKTHPKLLEAPK